MLKIVKALWTKKDYYSMIYLGTVSNAFICLVEYVVEGSTK
jgi:hypothetical protein